MKINLKNLKAFILPALIVFLIFIITVFILIPRVRAIVDSRQTLLKDKKTLADLTKKLAALEGLAQVEFSEKVDVALAVLPAEKDVPNNLAVIKNVALNNGLIVNNITIGEIGEISSVSSTGKTAKNAILPSFKTTVSLIGEVEMIKNFINQIQSTAPLMSIESVSISQRRTETPETNLEIEAYFLPFPKTLGKPEQQLVAITSGEEKIFSRLNEFTFFRSETNLPNLPVGKENLFSP